MFSKVGEKLKQCRKEYNIKQIHFESYGFSASYISMIEKGVREAPTETIKQIYNALFLLTQGEIEKLYSLDKFIMTEEEEALYWIKENNILEVGLSNYSMYKNICIKYGFEYYLNNIDEKLAYYYQQEQKYDKSNQYFINCIYKSESDSYKKAIYYREIGMNYQKCGSYYESLLNLELSLLHIGNRDKLLEFKNKYDLAKVNYFLENLNQSYFYIDNILDECTEIRILGASILLKELLLKKEGKFSEAIKILEDFIKQETYKPFLKNAYHNLGCNLKEQGAYQDAIRILNLGIKYCDTELDKALMKFLLGDIYYCLGEYNKVHIYYEECKILLLKESSLYNKKTIIKKLINLYAKQKDITAIENLLKEIDTISERIQKKELINECKIEIYRLLVRREIELSDYIEQYITKT
ncbi:MULTISPECIES: helix-turn-helix domain-containing protein [Turicibacter]|uniref:helix-turn-helix domain-containing protein n=2 Tax=Turicibacteraceae TaxID=2810281 RepID=UPI0001FDAFA9|nr:MULTISPECIES: helix-turn-helix transcriptional regulator [Turicibacter]EGC93039.1 tetratricopeptide repeat protein [Turicibacter sp. HGF1]